MNGITLFLLIGVFALVLFWLDTSDARDQARDRARRICKNLGVQLLDQTVALHRTRLSRAGIGLLGLERCFQFEFSETGNDRNHGQISLLKGATTRVVLEGTSMGRVVIDGDQTII